MSLTLSGYLRDNPGGAAIAGDTVSLLDVNTGLAPTTTAHTNLSATTDVTDANGYWEFTMDLCTGPLRVSVDLGGGDTRQRRNTENFQYGAYPISGLVQSFQGMGTGVIHGVLDGFSTVAGATRLLTISPGYASIKGHLLGWDAGTKTKTGSVNGSVGTTRYDFLCLRQYYSGTYSGQQDIVLIEGGSSTDPVVTSTESDLTQFIQGATIWDLPIYRCQLAYGASVYTIASLRGSTSYPYIGTVDNNAHAFSSTLSVAGATTLTGLATLEAGLRFNGNSGSIHYGTTPTLAYGAGAGTGGSLASAIEGTDRKGKVTVTTGSSGVAAGILLRVSFNTALSSANYLVNLTPADSDSVDVGGFVNYITLTTTYWELSCRTLPANNTSHHWFYNIEQYDP
jgi:hypothetical protein